MMVMVMVDDDAFGKWHWQVRWTDSDEFFSQEKEDRLTRRRE